MNDSPPRLLDPFRQRALLLLFLAVCYFWALGHYPLIDPDEPVYAECGKLMAASHSFAAWWTPRYDGAMWFDKPPLTYWLVGLSMKALGPSELAARLPIALAGLLLVWLTARLARKLYPTSPATPVWAAGVIGTCLQTLVLSHACTTDMFFVCALTCALADAWKWLESGRRMAILRAGLAVGIGILIKGPAALVLLGGALLLYLLWIGQGKRFFESKLWAAVALALLVSLPWYVSMYRLHGMFFVQSFLEAQNIGRFLNAEHPATSSPLFFVPILLAGFLPWTFAFVPALVSSFRRARQGERADLFALIWIGLVFVFFSASRSKLVTYIYPLYPAAACLTAYWISEVCRKPLAGKVSATAGALLGVTFAALASLPYWRHPDPKAMSAVEMGRAVGALSRPQDTVYALTFNKPSLVYYSDRRIVFTDNQEVVGPLLGRPPYPLCVTKPDIIAALERKRLLAPYKILSRTGTKVVLLQCIPPVRGGS